MRRDCVRLLLLAGVLSCADDPTSPEESRPESQLSFIKFPANVPTLANTTGSFWAKKGRNSELRLYYRPRAGRTDSTEFLRFKVDQDGLLRRPDGTTIATGDSILITVRVVDASKALVEFQPSGLTFSSDKPAELKFDFSECRDDLNGDGAVNATDQNIKQQLSVWRQEVAGAPWVKLSSLLKVETNEITAKLVGFTAYALAY